MSRDEFPDASGKPSPPKVYPRLNRRLRILMGLAFVGGPVMIGMGAYEYLQANKLKTEGVPISGKLIEGHAFDGGKDRISYLITLGYQPIESKTRYRKEFKVTEALYLQAQQAGLAQVIYLPSDPLVSVAGNSVPINTESFAIGGALLMVALALWFYLRRMTRQVEAYVRGQT